MLKVGKPKRIPREFYCIPSLRRFKLGESIPSKRVTVTHEDVLYDDCFVDEDFSGALLLGGMGIVFLNPDDDGTIDYDDGWDVQVRKANEQEVNSCLRCVSCT